MNFELSTERPPRLGGYMQDKYRDLRIAIRSTLGTDKSVKLDLNEYPKTFRHCPAAMLKEKEYRIIMRRRGETLYLWAEPKI